MSEISITPGKVHTVSYRGTQVEHHDDGRLNVLNAPRVYVKGRLVYAEGLSALDIEVVKASLVAKGQSNNKWKPDDVPDGWVSLTAHVQHPSTVKETIRVLNSCLRADPKVLYKVDLESLVYNYEFNENFLIHKFVFKYADKPKRKK